MKTRNFYAIAYHNDFALNDSAEKVKEWNTATVYAFSKKADRDDFVTESHLNYECSAKYAAKCGGATVFR